MTWAQTAPPLRITCEHAVLEDSSQPYNTSSYRDRSTVLYPAEAGAQLPSIPALFARARFRVENTGSDSLTIAFSAATVNRTVLADPHAVPAFTFTLEGGTRTSGTSGTVTIGGGATVVLRFACETSAYTGTEAYEGTLLAFVRAAGHAAVVVGAEWTVAVQGCGAGCGAHGDCVAAVGQCVCRDHWRDAACSSAFAVVPAAACPGEPLTLSFAFAAASCEAYWCIYGVGPDESTTYESGMLPSDGCVPCAPYPRALGTALTARVTTYLRPGRYQFVYFSAYGESLLDAVPFTVRDWAACNSSYRCDTAQDVCSSHGSCVVVEETRGAVTQGEEKTAHKSEKEEREEKEGVVRETTAMTTTKAKTTTATTTTEGFSKTATLNANMVIREQDDDSSKSESNSNDENSNSETSNSNENSESNNMECKCEDSHFWNDCSHGCSASTVLTGRSGTVDSDEGGAARGSPMYVRYTHCVWYVVPEGSGVDQIVLNFTRFSLTNGNDYVLVRTLNASGGLDRSSRVVRKFSGTTLPPETAVRARALALVFVTDYDGSSLGFRVAYTVATDPLGAGAIAGAVVAALVVLAALAALAVVLVARHRAQRRAALARARTARSEPWLPTPAEEDVVESDRHIGRDGGAPEGAELEKLLGWTDMRAVHFACSALDLRFGLADRETCPVMTTLRQVVTVTNASSVPLAFCFFHPVEPHTLECSLVPGKGTLAPGTGVRVQVSFRLMYTTRLDTSIKCAVWRGAKGPGDFYGFATADGAVTPEDYDDDDASEQDDEIDTDGSGNDDGNSGTSTTSSSTASSTSSSTTTMGQNRGNSEMRNVRNGDRNGEKRKTSAMTTAAAAATMGANGATSAVAAVKQSRFLRKLASTRPLKVARLTVHVEGAVSERLDPNEVVLSPEPLGVGAFGVVYPGRYRGRFVAVKVMSRQQDLLEQITADFEKEIDLYRRLHHPLIVDFVGASLIPGKLCMCTELIQRGSLEQLLAEADVPLALQTKFALNIAEAVAFLHANNVLYRDLKPSNVMVVSTSPSSKVCCKIGDFGTARNVKDATELYTYTAGQGTPVYMAPEVLDVRPYNHKADVYSFAITLWQTATREKPWAAVPVWDVPARVIRGKRPPMPATLPADYAALIRRCWAPDPNARPSFAEILELLLPIAAHAKKEARHNHDHDHDHDHAGTATKGAAKGAAKDGDAEAEADPDAGAALAAHKGKNKSKGKSKSRMMKKKEHRDTLVSVSVASDSTVAFSATLDTATVAAAAVAGTASSASRAPTGPLTAEPQP